MLCGAIKPVMPGKTKKLTGSFLRKGEKKGPAHVKRKKTRAVIQTLSQKGGSGEEVGRREGLSARISTREGRGEVNVVDRRGEETKTYPVRLSHLERGEIAGEKKVTPIGRFGGGEEGRS